MYATYATLDEAWGGAVQPSVLGEAGAPIQFVKPSETRPAVPPRGVPKTTKLTRLRRQAKLYGMRLSGSREDAVTLALLVLVFVLLK